MTVRLFGPLEVSICGERIPSLRTRKGQWLFALLALRHGCPVDRDWLAETLWPDGPPDAAPANLRRTLTDLRRVLGPAAGRLLSPSRLSLCLDLSGAEVDLIAFDAAIARSDRRSLERAIALYRGPLLESCAEFWALPERQHREAAFLAALETVAAQALADGDPATAEGYLRRAAAADPLRETAQRALMQALAAGGSHAAAFVVYRELCDRLHKEVNAAPDEETRALFARLQAEVARSKSADRRAVTARSPGAANARLSASKAAAPSHNLPERVTSFIGREREIAEIQRLLTCTRLLTITGAGGCGKSRLAVEAVRALLPDRADGVWLVELASLAEGELIPQAVATVLGVRERPGEATAETLIAALRPKGLLLLLDNCEHLLAACGALVDTLLRYCPHVIALATSREPLDILGETTYRIPPLSLPPIVESQELRVPSRDRVPPEGRVMGAVARALPHGRGSALSTLNQSEAVRLFVERARAAQPSFVLTLQNAGSVARICRCLDGIPLALELAAARVRGLPVPALAERIGDCLRLLTGGNRAALRRHRTLRAMIDWSHDLLSEPERILLRRLSVFAGGWILEAAEAVCADAGDEGKGMRDEEPTGPTSSFIPRPSSLMTEEVLDLLSGLVDKSLVVAEPGRCQTGSGEEARYRLLETVREYARERLRNAGEEAAARARHLGWFLGLARRAEPELSAGNQAGWLERLEIEHDNLRGALEWGLQNQPASALPLAVALWRFWDLRGHWTEGRRTLHQVLEHGGDAPVELLARASGRAGWLAQHQGDYVCASELAAAGLEMSRAVGDRQNMAHCLHTLGSVAVTQGKYEESLPFLEESLAIQRELGGKRGIAAAYNILGMAVEGRGDLAAARALLETSLAMNREVGNQAGQASNLVNLGRIARKQEEYAAARAFYQQSLAIAWENGDRRVIAQDLQGIAMVAGATGAAAAAARLLGASEATRDAVGYVLDAVIKPSYDHALATVCAALGEEAFAAAWAEGRALSLDDAVAHALEEDAGDRDHR